jgi:membrane protein implicated in regulation of membrane protease activity
MTWMMDVMLVFLFGLFLLFILGGLGAAAYAWWDLLPDTGRTTLKRALRRLVGRQGSARQGEPIYSVRVDGQLRYASGQEDVQHFLLTAMTTASRQVLRSMTDAHPATLVFTCGSESVVIEVHLA